MMTSVRILIVDDELSIINIYKRILERAARNGDTPGGVSYDLTTCTSALDALAEIKKSVEEDNKYAVAFIDINLADGENGVELGEQIREYDMHMNIIFVTGYTNMSLQEISERVLPPENLLYLEKPLDNPEVVQCAAALSSKWLAEQEAEKLRNSLADRVIERTQQLSDEAKCRETAEKALRSKSEYLNTILKHVQAGIILINNRTNTIVDVNKYGCVLFQRRKDEIIGQIYNDLVHDSKTHIIDETNDGLQQLTLEMKDGSKHTVLKNSALLSEDNDEFVLVTMIDFQSIYDANEKQRELESRMQGMQHMEALGTLSRGISHDFKNILCAIDGYAQMAQMYLEEDNPVYACLTSILEGVKTGRELCQMITNYGKEAISVENPVPLTPVIKSCLKLLQGSLPLNIGVTNNFPEQSPEVLMPETQIHQIIMNISINAVHAMEELDRKCVLNISVTNEETNHGPKAIIKIKDTGCGIPDDIKERIFEPNFTTKPVGKGTGVGLSTVRTILRNFGGTIELESEVGVGTTFTITIPSTN